jgi:6-pyruvoyltetrahydropterin/6-carboxytetrahydropterin synthase
MKRAARDVPIDPATGADRDQLTETPALRRGRNSPPTVYLTRVVHFSAAHRYYREDWSEKRNHEVFGPCANPHGHGHNYTLEVMVGGVPDLDTGFCVDLGALDKLLEKHVREPLDHQHVNHAVPEFGPGGQIPSTENLVVWIWRRLAAELKGAKLVRLRLREDSTLFVDYFGDGTAEKSNARTFET